MNLDPIRDYIASNSDLITGKDLFSYFSPHTAQSSVLLVTGATGNMPDHEVKGVFKGRYQVIVRDPNYDAAKARASALYDLLNLLETDMGEYVVTYSRPRNTPVPFSRSEGDLVEFSINYDIRYRDV